MFPLAGRWWGRPVGRPHETLSERRGRGNCFFPRVWLRERNQSGL